MKVGDSKCYGGWDCGVPAQGCNHAKNCTSHVTSEPARMDCPDILTVRMQRDVHERTTALDKERFEVACLRQDIIDEYEKKSGELLDYLNTMESAFERQRREFDVREAPLLKLNEDLKDELSCGSWLKYKAEKAWMSKTQHQQHYKTSWEVERALDILKEESSEYKEKYRSEQRRVQELEVLVHDLQRDVERSEEVSLRQKRRIERTKKRMDEENQELRRKAALGWMLGSLSDMYLRLDSGVGAAGILKLVKKVQRELESGSDVFEGRKIPPKGEFDLIQQEIMHLIRQSPNAGSRSTTTTKSVNKVVESCAMIKETASKNFSEGELAGDAETKTKRRRRRWRNWWDQNLSTSAAQLPQSRPSTPPPSTLLNLETCHPPRAQNNGADTSRLLQNKPIYGEAMDLKKQTPNSNKRTWAEIRLLNNDEASRAAAWASTMEVKGLLKGLETSMTFLMSQERRRRA